MPFYCTSALYEHPFFFYHHLKPSPFADFDDYMLSENFVFLDSEYFPSWRLRFELIFGLMHGFCIGWPSLEISHYYYDILTETFACRSLCFICSRISSGVCISIVIDCILCLSKKPIGFCQTEQNHLKYLHFK